MEEEEIVSIKIFPPIGIARVGNSPNDFFIGPEIPGVVNRPDGGYKDEQGRIKRQAARFRLFGYDRSGELVGEVTLEDAEITWEVQLAHKKASTIHDSTSRPIVPRSEPISGAFGQVHFNTAHFETDQGISPNPINLGEIRTDENGRLLILGGFGKAGNHGGEIMSIEGNLIRNDGYYDDISDGSINAVVRFREPDENGERPRIEALGAWVVVAPPDFVPEINSAITIYDRLVTYHNTHGLLPENFPLPTSADYTPSFTHDIYPILKRAWEDVQQVMNIHPDDIIELDYDLLSSLPEDRNLADEALNARRTTLRQLRRYEQENENAKIPRTKIDNNIDYIENQENTPSDLTAIQFGFLTKWAEGDFESDWSGSFVPHNEITPEGLTQAALDSACGTSLGPGIEIGDNAFNTPELYFQGELFRLNQESADVTPGFLTEELGVPWHLDFVNCGEFSSHEDCQEWVDVAWWPAQRPTHVYDPNARRKQLWTRGINDNTEIITTWNKLGFIVQEDSRFQEAERGFQFSITLLTPQLNLGTARYLPDPDNPIRNSIVDFVVFRVVPAVDTDLVFGVIEQPQAFELETLENGPITVLRMDPEQDSEHIRNRAREVTFPIRYTSQGVDEIINSTVTIICFTTGQQWVVPLTANSKESARNAISLVLDKSGSMTQDRGDGMAKVESLRKAASTFVNLMHLGDGVSITAFSADAESLTREEGGDIPTVLEITDEEVRENLVDILNNDPRLDPQTTTSIGDGIQLGAESLENANGFNRNAMVILTDGVENEPTLIHEVAHLVNSETYAIGIGQGENVNVTTLQHLTGNHGGYLLLTGDIEDNNQFRLEKHFMQVLTGIEQKEIVYDPDGTLYPGQSTTIPFIISDAENTLDAILLSTHNEYTKWHLVSPSGHKIDPETASEHQGVNYRTSNGMSFFRLSLPFKTGEGRATSFGEWKAVISHTAKKGEKPIHYNFNVHAHSQLSFKVNGYQEPHNPFNFKLEASVMQYVNLPVENASVTAEVTTSDGQIDRFVMQSQKPGKFAFEYHNAKPGVHHIRLMARGTTFKGTPFQREQTLSFPVVLGGEKPQTNNTWELDLAEKPKPSYRVFGKVTDSKGKGIPNLTIKAVDQDFTGENQLGKISKTDGNGNYSIPYALKDFAPHGKESNGADIILYIQNGKGETIHATKPLRNAKKVSRVNATIANQ